MRGTPDLFFQIIQRLGIIPAYAGNTIMRAILESGNRDHPRVCGEHSPKRAGATMVRGSSPRMRGTLRLPAVAVFGHGIIPAYAGNTGFAAIGKTVGRDHPRVCGEHSNVLTPCRVTTGSSPRMRGTPGILRLGASPFGIIPAYAGNTNGP